VALVAGAVPLVAQCCSPAQRLEVQATKTTEHVGAEGFQQPIDDGVVGTHDLEVVAVAGSPVGLLGLGDDPRRRPPEAVPEPVGAAVCSGEGLVGRWVRQFREEEVSGSIRPIHGGKGGAWLVGRRSRSFDEPKGGGGGGGCRTQARCPDIASLDEAPSTMAACD